MSDKPKVTVIKKSDRLATAASNPKPIVVVKKKSTSAASASASVSVPVTTMHPSVVDPVTAQPSVTDQAGILQLIAAQPTLARAIYDDRLPFFRTFDPAVDPQFPYSTKDLPFPKCHWGQRKLLWSEIEFYSLVSYERQTDLSDYCVIYAGAADGAHQAIIRQLFPKLQLVLYDPAKFAVRADELVTLKTGPAGFFSDATVPEALSLANGRRILFISDIRKEVNEREIAENMVDQQRWGILLQADYMLLKCRLPYDNGPNAREMLSLYQAGLAALPRNRLILPTAEPPVGSARVHLPYLSGTILFQIYAPRQSSETRLLVRANPTTGKYRIDYYDVTGYDSWLHKFNQYYRVCTYRYRDNYRLTLIPNFDRGYESTTEYYIICQYLESLAGQGTPMADRFQLLRRLDTSISRLNHRSLVDCIRHTEDMAARRTPHAKNEQSAKRRAVNAALLTAMSARAESLFRVQSQVPAAMIARLPDMTKTEITDLLPGLTIQTDH